MSPVFFAQVNADNKIPKLLPYTVCGNVMLLQTQTLLLWQQRVFNRTRQSKSNVLIVPFPHFL